MYVKYGPFGDEVLVPPARELRSTEMSWTVALTDEPHVVVKTRGMLSTVNVMP
jgi:hypothetical protein